MDQWNFLCCMAQTAPLAVLYEYITHFLVEDSFDPPTHNNLVIVCLIIWHSGLGLEINIALGFVSCCIGLLIQTLMLYYPHSTIYHAITITHCMHDISYLNECWLDKAGQLENPKIIHQNSIYFGYDMSCL